MHLRLSKSHHHPHIAVGERGGRSGCEEKQLWVSANSAPLIARPLLMLNFPEAVSFKHFTNSCLPNDTVHMVPSYHGFYRKPYSSIFWQYPKFWQCVLMCKWEFYFNYGSWIWQSVEFRCIRNQILYKNGYLVQPIVGIDFSLVIKLKSNMFWGTRNPKLK